MDALHSSAPPTGGPITRGVRACAVALSLAVLAFQAGCGANDASSFAPPSPSSMGGSPAQMEVEVRFDPADPLVLAPREEHEVTVVVRPRAAHEVRFALADAHDAALDKSAVVTDTMGRASARLTAPSTVGSFTVRAFVGEATASLRVAVRAPTSTIVEVVPVYRGSRTVAEWVASVHLDERCATFGVIPRDDGELFARFPPDQTATLGPVKLSQPLAVSLRAGQFLGGCTDVQDFTPGTRLRVTVEALDRPVDLEATKLELALGVAAQDSAFSTAVEDGVAALLAGFRGEAETDAAALLDGMDAELARRIRPLFQSARAVSDLDGAVAALRSVGDDALSETIAGWVAVGQRAFLSNRAFEAFIQADLASPSGAPALGLDRLGQLAGTVVGAEVTRTSWSVDPSDMFAVGATLSWQHAALIAGLALAPARAATGASDVAAALAETADCGAIGAAITARASTSSPDLIAACDTACLSAACTSSLAMLWDRAATQDLPATLAFTGVGGVAVGGQAQIVEVKDGRWIGRLGVLDTVYETSGAMSAEAPRYTAR